MGMYVVSTKPVRNPPSLLYNWSGWSTLVRYLKQWGVNTNEFSGFNDGERISAHTCRNVADAIEANYKKLLKADRMWLKGHAKLWRRMAKAGGCEQW